MAWHQTIMTMIISSLVQALAVVFLPAVSPKKGYSVAVMEMGRRWKAEDFAKNNWNTRRWIWRPGMKLFGYFNMRFFAMSLLFAVMP